MDDDFFSFLQILTSIIAGIVFVCAQYDLCISKPNEWFIGAIAGVIAVYSSYVRSNSVRSRKRE